MLLWESGLSTLLCHIINNHVLVRAGDEESPIRAGRKLIVIDDGFCEVYRPTTGTAGYTLIYNLHGMRIRSRQPFGDVRSVLEKNKGIQSRSDVFETRSARTMIMGTDNGNDISNQIYDPTMLLSAYRQGPFSLKVTKRFLPGSCN